MANTLGGKSLLTSDGILLLYYATALLSLALGFTILIPLVGSFISRLLANKEGSLFVEQHCTWIFRSVFITLLLICTIAIGGVFSLGATGIIIPDTSQINSFSELWADPTIRLAMQYIFAMLAAGILVILWFVYRLIRGWSALINRRPIKEVHVHTHL